MVTGRDFRIKIQVSYYPRECCVPLVSCFDIKIYRLDGKVYHISHCYLIFHQCTINLSVINCKCFTLKKKWFVSVECDYKRFQSRLSKSLIKNCMTKKQNCVSQLVVNGFLVCYNKIDIFKQGSVATLCLININLRERRNL